MAISFLTFTSQLKCHSPRQKQGLCLLCAKLYPLHLEQCLQRGGYREAGMFYS